MNWKNPLLCVLVSAFLATHALAQVPKNPRAPAIPTEIVLGEVELFGGAIRAIVEVAEVDVLTPGFLDGMTSSGLADIHFEVQLRAAQDNVLGARSAGEFIPYQTINVRIENRSQPRVKCPGIQARHAPRACGRLALCLERRSSAGRRNR